MEVRDIIQGAIDRLDWLRADIGKCADQKALATGSAAESPYCIKPCNAEEEHQVTDLRGAGKSEGYIIGWLNVGRGSPFSRQAANSPVEIIVDSEVPTP